MEDVQAVFVGLIKRLFAKKIFRLALFLFIGAAGGYAYYYFIGCYSGTCPLTNNPYISTLYGAIIGLLLTPNLKKLDDV